MKDKKGHNIMNDIINDIVKNWKSVRITHAGSWMVCKQYIVLNHMLSEKMHFWSQLLTDFHIWPIKSKFRTSSTRKK